MAEPRVPAVCIAEAVATFILCLVAAGAVVTDAAFGIGGLPVIALATGLALSAAITASIHVSGAHLNPAVTLVLLATGRIAALRAAAYVGAQLLGATAAAAIIAAVFSGVPEGAQAVAAMKLGATAPGPGVSGGAALATEMVITFVLVFVIFGSAIDARAPAGFAGFAIGLTVAALILLAGPISGASMNPARSFGPALVGGAWTAHWIYWIGPAIGGLAGGLLYHVLILGGRRR